MWFKVHVVWSEHSKPYRRETIATKFCDVLIVLERADEKVRTLFTISLFKISTEDESDSDLLKFDTVNNQ